jgi:hypothetical protein
MEVYYSRIPGERVEQPIPSDSSDVYTTSKRFVQFRSYMHGKI